MAIVKYTEEKLEKGSKESREILNIQEQPQSKMQ